MKISTIILVIVKNLEIYFCGSFDMNKKFLHAHNFLTAELCIHIYKITKMCYCEYHVSVSKLSVASLSISH